MATGNINVKASSPIWAAPAGAKRGERKQAGSCRLAGAPHIEACVFPDQPSQGSLGFMFPTPIWEIARWRDIL